MPKVSVVIPCFNAEAFVAEAVRSVLDQTLTDLECIVVDDCSTDRSRDVVAGLAAQDTRVRLLPSSVNSGPSLTRNRGMAEARGDYTALLDADDLFRPERLEILTGAIVEHGADAAIDNQCITDFPKRERVQKAFRFLPGGRTVDVSLDTFFGEEALFTRYLRPGYMKPVFRTDWLRATGIQFDPGLRVGEDFLFYAELYLAGMKCVGVGAETYVYRRRSTSLSRSFADNLRSIADVSGRLMCNAAVPDTAKSHLARKQRSLLSFVALATMQQQLRARNVGQATRTLVGSPSPLPALALSLRRRLPVWE